MAKILFGSMVTDIRGSIGGTTYSRNRSGNYVKNKSAVNNNRTTKRTTVRNLRQVLSRMWNADLTAVQRQSWNDATTNPVTSPGTGQLVQLSGFQYFISLNTYAAIASKYNPSTGTMASLSGPEIYDVVTRDPISLAFVGGILTDTSPGSNQLNIDGAFSIDGGSTLGGYQSLMIYSRVNTSYGVSNPGRQWKLIKVFGPNTDLAPGTGLDIASDYNAVFGNMVVPPTGTYGLVWLKAFVIDGYSGAYSVPLTISAPTSHY